MKIYEIISEATPGAGPQYTAGAAARRAATNAPASAAPTAVAPSTPKNVAKVAGRSGLAKTGSIVNKWDRLQKAIDLTKARKAAQLSQQVSAWTSRLGPWFWAFRILGVATAVEELVRNSYAAEDLFAEGEIEDENQLRDYRQFLWGQFLASFLIPALLSKMKMAQIVAWVARLLVTIATGAGGAIIGVGTGGAAAAGAVAAIIAEQTFFTALQIWLQMPSTTKWLADNLFYPLVMIGKIPENIWDMLVKEVTGTDAYDDAKEKRKTIPDAQKKKAPAPTDVVGTEKDSGAYNSKTGTIMPPTFDPKNYNQVPQDTSLQNQKLY